MRVLMLGWEFPPFISGGLGTACYGLTKALDRQNVEVLFVLPRSVDAQYAGHVRIISPASPRDPASSQDPGSPSPQGAPADLSRVVYKSIPSRITSPYDAPRSLAAEREIRRARAYLRQQAFDERRRAAGEWIGTLPLEPEPHDHDYAGDILSECQRYAAMALDLTRGESFDVIHAHDWMTYPAGLAIAAATGKPLVVHVHSTEFDRAGENICRPIYEIERRGMHGAMTVVCVSYLTANTAIHRYDVSPDKIEVVYNGIDSDAHAPIPKEPIRKGDKIVLFLGRITMQKGPEYFIAAAKKVIEKVEDVKFVVAGAGDMIERVVRLAAQMGIAHKVLFTGFLRGSQVQRIFRMADVYVMPSVSEPFGIAPLEAIRHDVPVIISRNSGVAEVVQHALKVDFWDVEDIANKIIAVLRHPPLSQTLREHADLEVRSLTWDGAASRCVQIYQDAIAGLRTPNLPVHSL